jgi:glucose 1-dehydrogenase
MVPAPATPTLSGKVALITGAATGIGRAIALAYANAGANVVINHEPNQPPPDDLLAQIHANPGGRAIAVAADVSVLDDHPALLEAAHTHFGCLDILVNNAGRQLNRKLLENTPQEWDAIMGVNLRGAYFLALAAARRMVDAGIKGRIINITSTHETKPLWGCSIYSISKSGLAMVTKSLALELAAHGITVNSLIPGAYRTPMNRGPYASPERLQRAIDRIPLHKIGEPEDIVGAALFLAGEHSAYMTGASIKVDGGLSL